MGGNIPSTGIQRCRSEKPAAATTASSGGGAETHCSAAGCRAGETCAAASDSGESQCGCHQAQQDASAQTRASSERLWAPQAPTTSRSAGGPAALQLTQHRGHGIAGHQHGQVRSGCPCGAPTTSRAEFRVGDDFQARRRHCWGEIRGIVR